MDLSKLPYTMSTGLAEQVLTMSYFLKGLPAAPKKLGFDCDPFVAVMDRKHMHYNEAMKSCERWLDVNARSLILNFSDLASITSGCYSDLDSFAEPPIEASVESYNLINDKFVDYYSRTYFLSMLNESLARKFITSKDLPLITPVESFFTKEVKALMRSVISNDVSDTSFLERVGLRFGWMRLVDFLNKPLSEVGSIVIDNFAINPAESLLSLEVIKEKNEQDLASAEASLSEDDRLFYRNSRLLHDLLSARSKYETLLKWFRVKPMVVAAKSFGLERLDLLNFTAGEVKAGKVSKELGLKRKSGKFSLFIDESGNIDVLPSTIDDIR